MYKFVQIYRKKFSSGLCNDIPYAFSFVPNKPLPEEEDYW